ncbi:CBS domain-containing protein [Pseudonocardia asaccharolytica]|uniref:CBS domain-containing protein n=1 Tax=Pseudonocardia asaccharolytica DSM 44247 = NBRC 16224 TaxID=1123024 RepID=A0A511CWZ6_9PSEU|nr:CBS domain-containing protein [Pseudonocardia asaccharolytica]GEL17090.1 CBS domain-containing protein [Pseudonocardia asaccharolytica DSM 44247 = NBRC 16224]
MPPMVESATPADPVKKIMAELVATVGYDESLRSVAQELVADEVGAVVVTSTGEPLGLISERDLVTVEATGGDLDTRQAADVMTTDLVTARREDSIESVGRLMLDAGVRHIVIKDGDDMVGLVSMRDVLAVLLEPPVSA